MNISARPMISRPFIQQPRFQTRSNLLCSCARAALLALPIAVPMGMGLSSVAHAQVALTPTTSGISLATLQSGTSFTLSSGTITGTISPVANSIGATVYGDTSQTWMLSNSGTITANGGFSSGVVFEAGGTVNNNAGGIINGQAVSVLIGSGGVVNNAGILQNGDDGVLLLNGGSVTNSGAISGIDSGIGVNAGSAIIVNSGTITAIGTVPGTGPIAEAPGIVLNGGGSVTNSGLISGVFEGVDIENARGVVVNSGIISASGLSDGALIDGDAVYLGAGGSVINSGVLTGLRRGITTYGGLGTITNSGTIAGQLRSGVDIASGGMLTNTSTGIITGGSFGVVTDGGVATVVNAGMITGGAPNSGNIGVQLSAGGSVNNQVGGTITGDFGVFAYGGDATVINAGTIITTGTASFNQAVAFGSPNDTQNFNDTVINSGLIASATGVAVAFGNGTNLLELLPGASFVGAVNGGTGTNVMEFGAGTGTGSFTGLGSSNFTGFNTVKVDAGASWNFTGANVVSQGVSLTNAGSLTNSGTLTNNGSFVDTGVLTNSGSIAGNVALSATGILNNTGAISVASGSAVTVTDGVASITNHGLIQATGTDGVGVLFTGSASGTVDNFGTIAGGSGTAVKFAGGTNELIIESGGVLSGLADGGAGTNTLVFEGTGSLTNAQILHFQSVQFASSSGSIDSGSTVDNPVITGVIANSGTLTGTVTVASGATLTNGGIVNTTTASTNSGNFSNTGAIVNTSTFANAGSLANSGTITTTGGVFSNSGSFANGSTGTVTGDTNGIVGGGQITNSGTILGTSGSGVYLIGPGTITNAAGGFIKGGQYGILVSGGGAVQNAGTILDDGVAGASLGSNASMTNASTGTIGGVVGVQFTGTGATLTNNGTITGTGGVAVQFDAGVNALTIGTGSVLNGAIDGGTGAGQITLAGTGSMGNTIQNFGAGSALTIASGADWTATGNWAIAGVTNAGILQPGVAGSPLKLTGDFTQSPTGTLRVALNADGTGSQLQVTGKATLGGTVAIVPSFQTIVGDKTYAIVTATDGVSGTFSGSTISTRLLSDVLTYDANDAFVTLFQRSIADNISGSANQHAVAVAIDRGSAVNPLGFAAAIAGIDTLSDANVRSSLDRLSGESHASLTTTALQAGSLFANQFHQQGVLARLGANGTASGQSAMLAGGRQNLARLDGGTDDPVANADMPWGVWASGYGQTGQISGDANSHRLDETIAGGTVGADYKVLPNLRIGAGIGYGGTTFSLDDGGGRGQVDHTQFALYGDYTMGAVYVDAMIGYAYGDGTTSRNVSLPGTTATANAHTTDNQVLGSVEAGYSLPMAGVALTPFVGLSFGSVDQNGFVENGVGALNLRVRDQSASSVKSTVGARVTMDVPVGALLVTTDLSAGWAHEYAPTSRSTVAAFAGAPAAGFQVAGAKVPGDSAQIGFGLATAVFANTSLYAHYDGDLASGASSNAVSAGLRFSW
jgi:outer membrane autotransporter protein